MEFTPISLHGSRVTLPSDFSNVQGPHLLNNNHNLNYTPIKKIKKILKNNHNLFYNQYDYHRVAKIAQNETEKAITINRYYYYSLIINPFMILPFWEAPWNLSISMDTSFHNPQSPWDSYIKENRLVPIYMLQRQHELRPGGILHFA